LRGKFAETFPQKHGSRRFRWSRAPPHHCREKTLSCRKKKTRHRFAFGSSQADLIKLMLERRLARTIGLKCLTWRRISPCRSGGRARNRAQVLELASASRPGELLAQPMRLNRFNRRGFSSGGPRGRQTAPVAAIPPHLPHRCRKTTFLRAVVAVTHLKSFN
jgi:hypothetical protein